MFDITIPSEFAHRSIVEVVDACNKPESMHGDENSCTVISDAVLDSKYSVALVSIITKSLSLRILHKNFI